MRVYPRRQCDTFAARRGPGSLLAMRASVALGAPLLPCLSLVLACGGETEDYTLSFEARAGGAPLRCGEGYTGMGASSGPVELRDFRLYVSDVRLVGADGAEAPLELDQDVVWQHASVALLDFEDGSGACSASGTPETRAVITGQAAIDAPTGVRFRIGVPFDLNHLDTATQPSPLNLGAMFWNWRGGYKFLRLDLRDRGVQPPSAFNIHLGATACDAPTPVQPPSSPCGRPNRPDIALDGFDPSADTIVLDLAGLLTGVDTSTNTPMTPPGCMSAPTDPDDCGPVFQNLGLSFASGACTGDCAGQRFVRVE
jgi:uncharacterized repeat protein (TIGR04052 family)